MEINVTARHGEISESVQQTIRQKVAKLPRFFERTTAIQVIVDLKKSDKPKVEVIFSAEETNDFVATDHGSNVIVALDNVIGKIEKQLRRHKEKITEHRGRDRHQPDVSLE